MHVETFVVCIVGKMAHDGFLATSPEDSRITHFGTSTFRYPSLMCTPPFPMISFQLQSIFKVSQQQQLHLSKPRVCTAISCGTADAKVVNTDYLSTQQVREALIGAS